MAFDVAIKTFDYSGNEDRTWLATRKGFDTCRSITLDVSTFTADHLSSKGALPSGLLLGKITATGKYGPYGGTSEEVTTITEGGSGLTSFTLTYSGQTTASIDDAATAAQVQAALEALSNIGAGEVAVTGDAGGPYTVTWLGTLANTDITLTATPTGGTGTVTIGTTTAGGATVGTGGLEVAAGFLFNTTVIGGAGSNSPGSAVDLTTAADVTVPLLWEGVVVKAKLPSLGANVTGQYDAGCETDLPHVRFE